MVDPNFMLDAALKAQQWERAKGELRAMVALQGSYAGATDPSATERWEHLKAAVEGFICTVEDDGLQE